MMNRERPPRIIPPGKEKRCEMIETYLELKRPQEVLLQIAASMRGKTDEEKERIAEQAVKDLRSGKL